MTKFSDLHFPGAPRTEIIKAADVEIEALKDRLNDRDTANKGLRYDLELWRQRSNRLSKDKAKLRGTVNRESQAYRECRDRERTLAQETHDLRATLAAEKRSSAHLQALNENQRERIEALLRDRRELAALTTNTVFPSADGKPVEIVHRCVCGARAGRADCEKWNR